MKKIPVAVVILNWNGRELLKACLASWAKADPAPERILVVDNGSTDGSQAWIKAGSKKSELLALKNNLGFAAGNNRGFDHLFRSGKAPQAVFICNNDTEVEPSMLGRLWDAMKTHPNWGLLAPTILFHGSDKVWFKGGIIRRLSGRPGHLGYGETDTGAGEAFELPSNGFVTGCGMLVRAKLLRELKGFDESFWSYAEDSDLCLRALALGWRYGVVPQARMAHKVSASFKLGSPLSQYYASRNSLALLKRHDLGLGALT
ncbi:MAG: glycosyltransferase family 2 protein, partial [candidate division FCPU426 bacterium]